MSETNDNISSKEAMCFLHVTLGNHPAVIDKMIEYFGNSIEAATAPEADYKEVLNDSQIAAILHEREFCGIQSAILSLESEGIKYCSKYDKEYPENLREVSGAPLSLFYRGSLPDVRLPSVAIVGARNCSPYGRQMAREYAREIAMAGIQVISGMAYGVDSIAGRATVDVDGLSYAVLGCGCDVCYPKESRDLYDKLVRTGGVISEFVPHTAPMPGFFPMRNRIISGLCDALLVVEARKKSGTLITVGTALEQGRDVYAIPGRVTDSLSYGCNTLLREGAMPALSPREFVEDFFAHQRSYGKVYGDGKGTEASANACDYDTKRGMYLSNLNEKERAVVRALDYTPRSVSEIFCAISDYSDITFPELMSTLTTMTLRHKISCIDGGSYYLAEM